MALSVSAFPERQPSPTTPTTPSHQHQHHQLNQQQQKGKRRQQSASPDPHADSHSHTKLRGVFGRKQQQLHQLQQRFNSDSGAGSGVGAGYESNLEDSFPYEMLKAQDYDDNLVDVVDDDELYDLKVHMPVPLHFDSRNILGKRSQPLPLPPVPPPLSLPLHHQQIQYQQKQTSPVTSPLKTQPSLARLEIGVRPNNTGLISNSTSSIPSNLYNTTHPPAVYIDDWNVSGSASASGSGSGKMPVVESESSPRPLPSVPSSLADLATMRNINAVVGGMFGRDGTDDPNTGYQNTVAGTSDLHQNQNVAAGPSNDDNAVAGPSKHSHALSTAGRANNNHPDEHDTPIDSSLSSRPSSSKQQWSTPQMQPSVPAQQQQSSMTPVSAARYQPLIIGPKDKGKGKLIEPELPEGDNTTIRRPLPIIPITSSPPVASSSGSASSSSGTRSGVASLSRPPPLPAPLRMNASPTSAGASASTSGSGSGSGGRMQFDKLPGTWASKPADLHPPSTSTGSSSSSSSAYALDSEYTRRQSPPVISARSSSRQKQERERERVGLNASSTSSGNVPIPVAEISLNSPVATSPVASAGTAPSPSAPRFSSVSPTPNSPAIRTLPSPSTTTRFPTYVGNNEGERGGFMKKYGNTTPPHLNLQTWVQPRSPPPGSSSTSTTSSFVITSATSSQDSKRTSPPTSAQFTSSFSSAIAEESPLSGKLYSRDHGQRHFTRTYSPSTHTHPKDLEMTAPISPINAQTPPESPLEVFIDDPDVSPTSPGPSPIRYAKPDLSPRSSSVLLASSTTSIDLSRGRGRGRAHGQYQSPSSSRSRSGSRPRSRDSMYLTPPDRSPSPIHYAYRESVDFKDDPGYGDADNESKEGSDNENGSTGERKKRRLRNQQPRSYQINFAGPPIVDTKLEVRGIRMEVVDEQPQPNTSSEWAPMGGLRGGPANREEISSHVMDISSWETKEASKQSWKRPRTGDSSTGSIAFSTNGSIGTNNGSITIMPAGFATGSSSTLTTKSHQHHQHQQVPAQRFHRRVTSLKSAVTQRKDKGSAFAPPRLELNLGNEWASSPSNNQERPKATFEPLRRTDVIADEDNGTRVSWSSREVWEKEWEREAERVREAERQKERERMGGEREQGREREIAKMKEMERLREKKREKERKIQVEREREREHRVLVRSRTYATPEVLQLPSRAPSHQNQPGGIGNRPMIPSTRPEPVVVTSTRPFGPTSSRPETTGHRGTGWTVHNGRDGGGNTPSRERNLVSLMPKLELKSLRRRGAR